MARKKALKRPQAAKGDTNAVQTDEAATGYAGQVHTATLQPGKSASCNPIEVGPGYASEPFSVAHFKAECQDVLQQLAAHISGAGDLAGADLDMSDLRLISLDEELAAERAEAAHAKVTRQAAAAGGTAAQCEKALATAATTAAGQAAASAPAAEAAAAAATGQGATVDGAEAGAAASAAEGAAQEGAAAAPGANATGVTEDGAAPAGGAPAAQAAAATASAADAAAADGAAAAPEAAAPCSGGDPAAAAATQQSNRDAAQGPAQDDAAEATAAETVADGRSVPPDSNDQQAAKSGGRRRGTKRKQASESPGAKASTPEPQSPQLRRSRRNHARPPASAEAEQAQAAASADGGAAPADDAADAATLTLADIEAAGERQPAEGADDADGGRRQRRRTSKRGLGVKDMGVKFHPTVELELIERVKQRRDQRRAAAMQALTCLQAEDQPPHGGKAAVKPRRSTNYAPQPEAAAGTAEDAAADTAAGTTGAGPTAAAAAAGAGTAADGTADAASVNPGPAVDAAEVVLTVAMSHPANAQRVLQQWRVLGSQRLIALRDRLYCRSDLDMRSAGLAVPSGMFYIEGTFYNDMREAAAVDYSYPIRAFCHTHGLDPPPRPPAAAATARTPGGRAEPVAAERQGSRGAQPGSAAEPVSNDEADDAADASVRPPQADEERAPGAYGCCEMAHTTFEQLWLRIGAAAGYVYCHQGCCEHLLAVTDVRMLHPDDPQHASAYPELVYQKHSRKRKCELCERAPAVKVTYDDAFAPSNPAFWCLDCFNRMHYDEQRRLVSANFKVFDYVHD